MNNAASIALSRLVAENRHLAVIANNLANTNTPGYRAGRMLFNDWLLAEPPGAAPPGGSPVAFTQDRATWRSGIPGPIHRTGNPLDLALKGAGYFTVATPAGPRLTRAGHFQLSANGTITDSQGHALLDASGQPIRTAGSGPLTITADGTVSGANGPLGRIGVVVPVTANHLRAEGGTLLRATVPTRPVATPQVLQGAIEGSDVAPTRELTHMIDTERSFQMVSQFIQAEDDRQNAAIDKLGQPQN